MELSDCICALSDVLIFYSIDFCRVFEGLADSVVLATAPMQPTMYKRRLVRAGYQASDALISAPCMLWTFGIDWRYSKIQGPGLRVFVQAPATSLLFNTFTVTPMVAPHIPAEYVQPHDIELRFTDSTGAAVEFAYNVSITSAEQRTFSDEYSFASAVTAEVSMRVLVCGIQVGPARLLRSKYHAFSDQLARTLTVESGQKRGMVITSDGTHMVLSYNTHHLLHVYQVRVNMVDGIHHAGQS